VNTEPYEDLGGSHPGQPLPIKVKKLRNPGYQSEGCVHTTDPNGFMLDADSKPNGDRCACWEVE